ncbi:MAG TPA: 2-phosphosulfolactate phosphatase [Flavobacteriales bacterium]|nr:2-phosphosulfolactate phosphatase [Flavobacteriales bacterium]|tara:strand:+ start:19588 stop:20349 length:762 start_codon:yes stop_codon:yes gene_type:complete
MEESSGNSRRIEVVFSPAMFPVYFDNKDVAVVVIDVLRATSAICAAFDAGVQEVIPVATVEEAQAYKDMGYLVGAERKAEIVPGFDFGNSPLTFKDTDKFKDKSIVLTTTNGTRAIEAAQDATHLLIGAFTNLDAVCKKLEELDKDVLLFCAGWKDRFNLEDTLLAGAITKKLSSENLRFSNLSDSALASISLYNEAEGNLYQYLGNSSHRRRLSSLNLEEDIIYCLTPNQTEVVPVLHENKLVTKIPELTYS